MWTCEYRITSAVLEHWLLDNCGHLDIVSLPLSLNLDNIRLLELKTFKEYGYWIVITDIGIGQENKGETQG